VQWFLRERKRNHVASPREPRTNKSTVSAHKRQALDEKDEEGRGSIAMANILVNIEKGIEIGAADALKWLSGADKALQATPAVVAALATLVGAVEKPLSELAGAAANPLNIPLDIQTVTDLKAVWPQVTAFLGTLGVKL
jgi:hypothetical protein